MSRATPETNEQLTEFKNTFRTYTEAQLKAEANKFSRIETVSDSVDMNTGVVLALLETTKRHDLSPETKHLISETLYQNIAALKDNGYYVVEEKIIHTIAEHHPAMSRTSLADIKAEMSSDHLTTAIKQPVYLHSLITRIARSEEMTTEEKCNQMQQLMLKTYDHAATPERKACYNLYNRAIQHDPKIPEELKARLLETRDNVLTQNVRSISSTLPGTIRPHVSLDEISPPPPAPRLRRMAPSYSSSVSTVTR